MDIKNAIEEIRDILHGMVERGTIPPVVRCYVLTERVLECYFHEPDDTATLAEEEHVYLAARAADTFAGPPLPPAA